MTARAAPYPKRVLRARGWPSRAPLRSAAEPPAGIRRTRPGLAHQPSPLVTGPAAHDVHEPASSPTRPAPRFVEAHRTATARAPTWRRGRRSAPGHRAGANATVLAAARRLAARPARGGQRRRCWSAAGWPTRPDGSACSRRSAARPGLVAAVLLAEYLVVALLASGRAGGRMADRPDAHRLGRRPPRQPGPRRSP